MRPTRSRPGTIVLLALLAALVASSCDDGTRAQQKEETLFKKQRDHYIERFKPLMIAANTAWWDAATTGADEAYERRKKAEAALAELHGNREEFAMLKELKQGQGIADPVLLRELLVLYNSYIAKQADPELNERIIGLEADVDQAFSTHRSLVDGEKRSENEVREILRETKDSDLARKAWTGYMEVGRNVHDKLLELVKLRNQVARKLGYDDYFSMQMEMQEFDEAELFALFDELDELTRQPFMKLKAEIDAHMVERFGIDPAALRPWHTGDLFFQDAPDLGGLSLDELYAGKGSATDPVKLSEAHYISMGMSVDDILARSDLYEKDGKSPHAFCTNIDRDQDIRVLGNVEPTAYWMDTMHHELGHGVYDKYIGTDVPFLLHDPSHILTTEGMAMLFGSLTKNVEFLREGAKVDAAKAADYAQAARSGLRAEKLIFSRWAQVMLRFEKGLYGNPDQDLNRLWWDLKKEYQGLNPPDDMSGADYAAKMHVVAAPVYYHNYMLGDLFASQVQCCAAKKAGIADPHSSCFWGNKEVGKYFRDEIFAPGNRYNWRDLTERATGEKLTARHYARLYVE